VFLGQVQDGWRLLGVEGRRHWAGPLQREAWVVEVLQPVRSPQSLASAFRAPHGGGLAARLWVLHFQAFAE
jgi:hypothetical protein